MQRDIVVNGWLFGVNPERPTRVRFARPFTKPHEDFFVDPLCGAITGLEKAGGEPEALRIECGSTTFLLTGDSAYNFTLHREATT